MKEIKIKKPKQKRSNEKFEAILDACPRVFDEFGYQKSTTARLALEADVNIATLYDYFSSKEAVFIAYLDRELTKALQAVAETATATHLEPHTMTREYVRISIDFACQQRDIIRVMVAEYAAIIPELDFAPSTKAMINTIGKNFEQNEKIRPRRRDSDVMVYTVTNIFLGFLFRIISMPNEGFERERIVDELTSLINHYIYGETAS